MKDLRLMRAAFVVAGLYDGILGVAFLVAGPGLFEWLKIGPPNHWGYIHFPAALLVVFAIAFFAVARDPRGNRNLIPYGLLLKCAYCGTVGYHWMTSGVPTAWKPFVFADIVFAALFVWAYGALGALSQEATER